MSKNQVLIVDDEPDIRELLELTLGRMNLETRSAQNIEEAHHLLSQFKFDLCLTDMRLPDGNGIDLVRNCRAAGIETTFIMVTGFASFETAVEALRAGASDYITKPVRQDEVVHRLSQIEAVSALREENKLLRKAASDSAPKLYHFTALAMVEVERLASKVAPTGSTVLITGESGTGKGVTARLIHDQSPRRAGAFLQVNCGAVPEHLLESEFFGHTKGAFTSADRAHKGFFQQADGGTIFLDEIGELPLTMQTKLLHIVEDKEVRPLGSEQVRKVDTRIITATNNNLEEMVREGKFRQDLYFRLSMFQIQMPPLRERQADIPGLTRFLLRNLRPSGASQMEIDPLVDEILLAHHWPGNVRELDNVINRAHILAEDNRISVADLPAAIIHVSSSRTSTGPLIDSEGNLRDQMRRFEVNILRRAIEDAGGDRRLAAQNLGVGLSSLYRKLEELQPQDVSNGDPTVTNQA